LASPRSFTINAIVQQEISRSDGLDGAGECHTLDVLTAYPPAPARIASSIASSEVKVVSIRQR